MRIVILCALLVNGVANAQVPGSAGHRAFARGDFGVAAEAFAKAQENSPADSALAYNRGVAEAAAGNMPQAVKQFERATQSEDAALVQQSWYNLGGAHALSGNLDAAIDAYKKSLEINPQDSAARENLAWAEEQKKQQQQQQQAQQQQKTDKPSKGSPSNASPPEPNPDSSAASAPTPRPAPSESAQMSKEDAQRILRGVQDDPSVGARRAPTHGKGNEVDAPTPPSENDRDW